MLPDDRSTDSPRFAGMERGATGASSRDAPPALIIEKLAPDVALPRRTNAQAAAYELKAYLLGSRVQLMLGTDRIARGPDPEADTPYIRLLPHQRALIPTGFRLRVPTGYEVQVRPDPEASFERGIDVVNALWTMDADPDGEVGILVKNGKPDTALVIEHGELVAQMVIAPVALLPIVEGRVRSAG